LSEDECIIIIFKGRFEQIFQGITSTQLLGAISANRNTKKKVLEYVKSILENMKRGEIR